MVDTSSSKKYASQMRMDWNLRATSNPLYAVDATKKEQSLSEFYESGTAIVAEILDSVLDDLRLESQAMTVLEIGCGVGRLFEGLSSRFGNVYGIDISQNMIDFGKANCPVDATWLIGDGCSLDQIPNQSVDYVLSFEVFQHIPNYAVIQSYFSEIFRVLRPGGHFQIQFRSGSDTVRQSIVRFCPKPLRGMMLVLARRLGITPVLGDVDSWLGVIVEQEKAIQDLGICGFQSITWRKDSSHPRNMGYWLIGEKRSEQPRSLSK